MFLMMIRYQATVPTCFGHSWGNICLNRLRKNVQLKTISKQQKNVHKTTSKLLQTTPKHLE